VAVSVNGVDISLQEYDRSFQNLYSYYREQFKDRFTDELIESMNLQKMALDSLIERALLVQEAKNMGLSVDKTEVSSRIQTFPAFQNRGSFDNDTYFQVLSYNKLKPRDFEAEQEGLILMEKVSEAIKKSAAISEGELLEAYKKDKITADLEFVKFSPVDFENGIKPGTKETKEYFASHVGDFTIPEKISLAYARFEPGDFLKEIELTNEDYEDYYKSYIDDFSIPAKGRASHILIKFGDDREKAKSDATALLERVKKGDDFATLAREHSGDTGSAGKGGDLGFFSRGMMVKPFEDAAFSMEKGEISELVETVYGLHIIKMTDFVEEKSRPLAEVKGEIRKVLESEISKELAQGRADDIYYEAIKGESLEALLKEEKVSYKKTDAFTLDNIPSSLNGLEDSVKEASKMEAGWISRPIELDNAFFIITLLEKQAPREPVFDEVASAVKGAVIKEKAREAAAKKAEEVLAMAKGGKSLRSLAANSGLKLEETGPFSRSRNFVPKIGISEEIVAKAFLLTEGAPLADKVYLAGDDAFVFRLKERKEIDAEAFEKEKELLRAKLLEKRREEVFQKWIEDTKGKASLEYNEDLINLRG